MSYLRRFQLTSFQLKVIALMTMVIDHAYKMLFPIYLPYLVEHTALSESTLIWIIIGIFSIGTITFPIFAYLVSEGCKHTRNIKKYISRLFLFAFISEIPFQILICTLNGTEIEFTLGFTNIFFTLAFGALGCTLFDRLRKKDKPLALCFIAPLLCIVAGFIFKTDYSGFGVLLIFVCYYFKDKKHQLIPMATSLGLIWLVYSPISSILSQGFYIEIIIESLIAFAYSLLSLVLIYFYDGKRGKSMKYFFYIFYPVHIILLYFVYKMF